METETTTTTNPTTIWTEMPAIAEGDNWAYAATDAWIAEAAAAGVTATEAEARDDLDYGTYAGTVEIDGQRYDLTVDGYRGRIVCEEQA